MNWTLRPEQLDNFALLEGRKDRTRYDFDASTASQPRYEFSNPFSTVLMNVDLRALAERDATLDIQKTVDRDQATCLTKCLELEKLQLACERQEEARTRNSKQFARQRVSSTALSRARAQSARSARRCTPDCVQVVCVGDCPEKANSEPCMICRKKTCNGSCTLTPYDAHIRGKTEPVIKARPSRPKSCNLCTKDSTTRQINASQLALGRPKSSNSTYSYTRRSQRQTLSIRSTNLSADLSENMSTVTIRGTRTPPRIRSARMRGRDSVAPHKAYHSQRRISLTSNTMRPVFDQTVRKRPKSSRSHVGEVS